MVSAECDVCASYGCSLMAPPVEENSETAVNVLYSECVMKLNLALEPQNKRCMLINYSQSWRMKIFCVCGFISWEGMVESSIVPLAGAVHGSESVNA